MCPTIQCSRHSKPDVGNPFLSLSQNLNKFGNKQIYSFFLHEFENLSWEAIKIWLSWLNCRVYLSHESHDLFYISIFSFVSNKNTPSRVILFREGRSCACSREKSSYRASSMLQEPNAFGSGTSISTHLDEINISHTTSQNSSVYFAYLPVPSVAPSGQGLVYPSEAESTSRFWRLFSDLHWHHTRVTPSALWPQRDKSQALQYKARRCQLWSTKECDHR